MNLVNTGLESKARGLRLHFIGFQEDGLGGSFPLWNIFNSPRPDLHPDGSTVSTEAWKETI